MSNLELLQQRKTDVITRIAAMTSSADDNPNIDGGGMGTVDHTGKVASLYAELKEINQLIAIEDGVWELPLIGRAG